MTCGDRRTGEDTTIQPLNCSSVNFGRLIVFPGSQKGGLGHSDQNQLYTITQGMYPQLDFNRSMSRM